MENNPKVSIVIPVYNGEDYVSEAIDSALAQTYLNTEIIVVNDGSQDRTEEIVKGYGERVKYFKKENGGVSTALNLGIEKMTGEYFQFLSHDDILMPNKIEKQIQIIKESGNPYTVVWGGWSLLNQETRQLSRREIRCEYSMEKVTMGLYPLLFSMVNGITVLFHRDFFDKVGVFDANLRNSQDYDMYSRVFRGTRTVYITGDLVHYRWHPRQGTQSNSEFARDSQRMSLKLRSLLTELDIEEMFGSYERYLYEISEFYWQCKWEKMYEEVVTELSRRVEGKEEWFGGQQKKVHEVLGCSNETMIQLYCAGANATRLMRILMQRGVRITTVYDGDSNKWGKYFSGALCVDPSKMDRENTLIIVTKDEPEKLVAKLRCGGYRAISFDDIGEKVFQITPHIDFVKDLA